MPEPITMSVLLLLKMLGGKVLLAKVGLIVKGLAATSHGHGALLLAKNALVAVKTYGFANGALMVAQMLIVLGTVAAGTIAADEAAKCLRLLADGDYPSATRAGTKALRNAGSIYTVWTPA